MNLEGCSQDNPCTAMQLVKSQVEDISKMLEKLEVIVDKLRNNLPPWVMGAAWMTGVVIGVLGTLVAIK